MYYFHRAVDGGFWHIPAISTAASSANTFLVDRKRRRRSKVTPSSHQPVKYALAQS
jgi:hypothetical protein